MVLMMSFWTPASKMQKTLFEEKMILLHSALHIGVSGKVMRKSFSKRLKPFNIHHNNSIKFNITNAV